MNKLILVSLAAPLVLAVAGCTTPVYVSPVEVTRFVGDTPASLGRGAIAVRAGPGEQPGSLEFEAYRSAVAEELRQAGYTVVGGDAAQVAEVGVERFVQQAEGRRGPVNVGVGGGTGSYGAGVGVGVGIDLTPRPAERIDTELRVMIKPASGGTALWEGRARFVATVNSDYAVQQAAAAKLADALFGGFPGNSGETIEVR